MAGLHTFTNPCSIEGQGDIFGMGIRISLYIQWYTTVLAYLYEPELATQCTLVNYCFSIAVAICALVHPGELHTHEVIIVAMFLLVPPMIVVISLIDNVISISRSAKPVGAEDGAQPNPNDPNESQWDPKIPNTEQPDPRDPSRTHEVVAKPYRLANWLRDIGVFITTAFLLTVSVWEFFEGVKHAKKADGCRPLFIRSHYLAGRYEVLLKTISIIFAVFTPSALIFLSFLRYTAGQQVSSIPDQEQLAQPLTLHLKLDGTTLQQQSRTWRLRVVFFDSPHSPFRKASSLTGPIKVRNTVAFFWGAMISFVIAQTETIIKQNQLQGVMDASETSQLIPLTIGVFTFCLVTYMCVINEKNSKVGSSSITLKSSTDNF